MKRAAGMARPPKPQTPFYRFNSSPEVIRLVVMMYVKCPLSLRNVEDLLAHVEELANYDAIAIGVGTHFGRVVSRMANFLDQAGGLWARGAFNGKVGAAFTSSATQHGGNEMTLFSIIANPLHFGTVVVGLPYSHQGQMAREEIVGGAPYGATTIAGGDGARQPSAMELAGTRHQGEVLAKTAVKLSAMVRLSKEQRRQPELGPKARRFAEASAQ
jgi:NAD(P)H:quinone oxidoreductase type IV